MSIQQTLAEHFRAHEFDRAMTDPSEADSGTPTFEVKVDATRQFGAVEVKSND